MSNLDPGKAGRAARRQSKAQGEEIARQKKIEDLKTAEEEDILGRKKLLAKTGGRSMLVASNPQGQNTTLGGS